MKNPLIGAAAVLLFAVYNYGMYRWLQSGHNLTEVWRIATSDWLVATTLLDAAVFVLLCILWLWRDAGQRGFSVARRAALVMFTLLLGAVVVLFYLSFRKNKEDRP